MTGPELRDWLADAMLSQVEFARLVKRDPRTVNRWLKGETPIPYRIERKLARERTLDANATEGGR